MPEASKMHAIDAVAAIAEVRGWNACRAAMLHGSQSASQLDELREQVRRDHAEWSDKTFGDVGPVGPLKHLSKEALEAAAEPDDLSEWADMQFLLWDAQRRAGISDGEITAAMEEKLKVNMAREWPEPKDGEPRLHIKAAGNSPVIPDGWVPVSERMPEDAQWCAVNTEYGYYVQCWSECHGWLGDEISLPSCDVTHWMPLPAAPQEEVKP
ncbi:dATP/dGTP pyrophosphohydrolase domain-containing protein [Citrobacter werkmanii]|uniref:dATP/dGTP pyrophosphohydrolase domain-containing protein n=1 Tax=Citrobacter werkmanii TaxID=67827 RepID=UPI00359FFF79